MCSPKCVKALYRRAVANERLKEYTNGLVSHFETNCLTFIAFRV